MPKAFVPSRKSDGRFSSGGEPSSGVQPLAGRVPCSPSRLFSCPALPHALVRWAKRVRVFAPYRLRVAGHGLSKARFALMLDCRQPSIKVVSLHGRSRPPWPRIAAPWGRQDHLLPDCRGCDHPIVPPAPTHQIKGLANDVQRSLGRAPRASFHAPGSGPGGGGRLDRSGQAS